MISNLFLPIIKCLCVFVREIAKLYLKQQDLWFEYMQLKQYLLSHLIIYHARNYICFHIQGKSYMYYYYTCWNLKFQSGLTCITYINLLGFLSDILIIDSMGIEISSCFTPLICVYLTCEPLSLLLKFINFSNLTAL